jgi:ABC-type phosphate/phosphonate transport system substrate-binding protein
MPPVRKSMSRHGRTRGWIEALAQVLKQLWKVPEALGNEELAMAGHNLVMNTCRAGPFLACFLIQIVVAQRPSLAPHDMAETLRIGTSGSLTGAASDLKEEDAIKTLQNFIKDETGMENAITRLKDWSELAQKLANKQVQIGVFQGYEFAWAQKVAPGLRPLALAVKVHRFPSAYIIALKSDKATDFGGLENQSLALPASGEPFVKLYVERAAANNGKKLEQFFSRITNQKEIEDAIDDVVDGTVQAAAVDQAALEAFKRRKPGRFALLKEVAHSNPFPPPVVAYLEKNLDDDTQKRFRDGLLGAANKERGQKMLSLFHLTRFENAASDLNKVLAQALQEYPPQGTPSQ